MKMVYVITDKFDYVIECDKLVNDKDRLLMFRGGKYLVRSNSFFDSFYQDNRELSSKEKGLKFDVLTINDYISYSILKDGE